MVHYHACPTCYEKWECKLECTIEPDLEDPACHPGKSFGAHCECNSCDTSPYQTKEFWDRYNGFIK